MKFSAIEVREQDITELWTDAVVNAANDRLWMGAGVAGALKRAGGDILEAQAVALGPVAIGEAVVTTAGKLHARWVIHAVVMGQDLKTSTDAIRKATRSSLRVAEEIGATSIGFPALGTGVGGFSLDECAKIMLDEVLVHEGEIGRVIFALFGARARQAFTRAIADAAVAADEFLPGLDPARRAR